MNIRLLLACLALCLTQAVLPTPLDTLQKPGEEQVKEAVKKAELDASLAAEDAMRHGHKAESRVSNNKDSSEQAEGSTDHVTGDSKSTSHLRTYSSLDSEDDDEKEGTKRVKEHRVNRKPRGKMLGLRGIGNLRGNSDDYKEDTRLEDRLAMEAEEEKKYETGEGYGTGGGAGGGGAGWDDAGKGVNWATNIQRQDAAEKQSIQAQVASESAHELDEIQRAIAAESQSSRGSASIGNGGASVVGGAASPVQVQGGMQPRITNPEGGAREGQTIAFEGGQQKSLSPSESQEISNFIHQADKLSPSEMRGATQPNGVGMGDIGARANQGLGGNIGSFGGLEGAQQIGGQNEVASIQQSPMAERFGGPIEAGAVGQEAMGQASLGGGAGLGESAISRMTEGTLGGRTGDSMQGLQGIQSMQDIQGVQGMQSMAPALTEGQGQGGMLNENGGVSALQGQGMMGANLQGGIQSILGGGGGGLGGLQTTMGAGSDIGQQQMAFKKRSKTHQKDETSNKRRKTKLRHKITRGKDAPRKKLLVGVHKTSVKKSKTVKKHHSRHSKTP
ncbi:spidroin-1-like isoform X9 [Acropora millepora]|uniref:spidroin-1-like isoform X9 n=1 Tax=Acropora millepora TaxID=45264 RepID=UPI001CF3FB6C|nr:spidroin-1-like isoform X9 [Acropora millepora]